ncbi:MAG TPA: hypothetical protein VFC10_05105 [Terriglobia bacterium]|nr:hypothetical protein [Terriglobia bacterium]
MDSVKGRTDVRLTIGVLVAGFIFLYLNLFYLPNTPIYLLVDQVTQLFDARRMLAGEVIYRDFFQVTPPGTQLVYLLLYKFFGVRAWIPNAMLIVLGLAVMWLMIVISRKVLPGKAALLPAVLFLIVPFRSQVDATHHWYSTLIALAGIALLMESRTPLRLAGAGALFGLSTCFTQTRGLSATVGVSLFLVWQARRKRLAWRAFWKQQFHLWWAFILVVIGFNAWFAWKTGLATFLNDTIVFGLRYYPAEAWNTYRVYMIDIPRLRPWYRLPALAIFLSIHLLIPLIYILFFVRYWTTARQNPDAPWDRLMLLSLTGFLMFLGIVSAPSWLRICAVSPPAVILFGWFWNSPGKFRVLRVNAVWVLAMLMAISECAEREIRWHKELQVPIGRIAIMDPDAYQRICYFLLRTKPGEYFFGDEMYNFLLDLHDPARVPYVTGSDYTRPSQVDDLVYGLKAHTTKYVLFEAAADMPPPSFGGSNHLGPFKDYLKRYYHFVTAFSDGEMVWERNEEPPDAAGGRAPARANEAQSAQ